MKTCSDRYQVAKILELHNIAASESYNHWTVTAQHLGYYVYTFLLNSMWLKTRLYWERFLCSEGKL